MKSLRTIISIFFSILIVLSIPTLSMQYGATGLKMNIRGLLNSGNKDITQPIAGINTANYQTGVLFNTILQSLNNNFSENTKSKLKQFINRLNSINDKTWNISQLALRFDKKSKQFKFLNAMMDEKMQEQNRSNFKALSECSMRGNLPKPDGKLAVGEKTKDKLDAKKIKAQLESFEQKIKDYKQAIEKRFEEETVNIQAVEKIIHEAQKVEQEIQSLQGAGDAGHTQQLVAWKKRLQQEKILQENAQKFARAQKKKIIQSMHALSRNLKALKADKTVIPAKNGNKNALIHAFTMQQIHRDPYWHAQFSGDARTIDSRNAAEKEIDSYTDAQSWWTAHEKDNKGCLACYNHALAMAKPNAAQKQRRNSF